MYVTSDSSVGNELPHPVSVGPSSNVSSSSLPFLCPS